MKQIYQQPSVFIFNLNVTDIVRTSVGVEFDAATWLGEFVGGNQ